MKSALRPFQTERRAPAAAHVGSPLAGAPFPNVRRAAARRQALALPSNQRLGIDPPPFEHRRGGFTLVEVLAALLMMAIIIPVAMEGMSVASRIGVLGQRKAAAMRVAERVLNEIIVENQTQQASTSGTALDGEISYPWTMKSQAWSEDAMVELTVTVTFVVQGSDYDVSASTLIAPTSSTVEAALPSQ
jgi:prepilin-type N-terminal cleavage/methylation domain-containing protein